MDRSVGSNIDEGLNCLSNPSDEDAPNHCVRYSHVVPQFSVDPSILNWSRSGGYNRGRWDFQFWPESGCGEWYDKVGCFLSIVDPLLGSYDVVSFQFSYLEVDNGSSIVDASNGFFADSPDRLDIGDLEAFEAEHPDKTVLYWTTSLARGIGSEESEDFNQQVRDYAARHGKVLFDVADILSHDPSGQPCYDNRDGVPYDNGNQNENHPDDGRNRLAICQHYTTEVEGGHLGAVSAGKIRVAQAFWVLMARVAGWSG